MVGFSPNKYILIDLLAAFPTSSFCGVFSDWSNIDNFQTFDFFFLKLLKNASLQTLLTGSTFCGNAVMFHGCHRLIKGKLSYPHEFV